MAVTQKQIADEVGVSQQLVTLALRGSSRVAPATREKILEAATRLGYNHNSNRHARSLAAKRFGKQVQSGIIAVIYERAQDSAPDDEVLLPGTAVPYFMAFVDGIEYEIAARDLDLFLVPARENRLPWLISEGWVDGVLLLGHHSNLYGLEELNCPVVGLGSRFDTISSVTPDDAGIQQAVQHLLSLGHRKFAYLGPRSWQSATERLQIFHEALQQAGIGQDETWIEFATGMPNVSAGAAAMNQIIQRIQDSPGDGLPFTAVVCHNDPMAVGALHTLQAAGWRVPDDVSLTGFDDVSDQYKAQPLITSVTFPRFEMGRRAVQLLCEAIKVPPQTDPAFIRETIPVNLAVHQSTTAPPRPDRLRSDDPPTASDHE